MVPVLAREIKKGQFESTKSSQITLTERTASRLEKERSRQSVVFYVISGYLVMIEADEQVRVRE